MIEELEAFNRIKREAGIPYFSSLYDIDMWREDLKTVETVLKAFEIIKTNLFIDFRDDIKAILFKQYKDQECDYTIIFCDTQEKYDLLKEVTKRG